MAFETRSTLDAIKLVVNTIQDAIAGIRWPGTLEIKDAFSSANRDCIMRALKDKNLYQNTFVGLLRATSKMGS